MKRFQIRSFFLFVFSRIRTEYGKKQTRKKLRIWTLFTRPNVLLQTLKQTFGKKTHINSGPSNMLLVWSIYSTRSLREKCPNTEFFLIHIFLYSVRMQENTDQKKLCIWTLFTQRIQLGTFEKSHIKSAPSNMLLRCTIYLTRSKRWLLKMFKTDLRKQSHEIRSMKFGPDV